MKNNFISRLDTAEERISELEDISIEASNFSEIMQVRRERNNVVKVLSKKKKKNTQKPTNLEICTLKSYLSK